MKEVLEKLKEIVKPGEGKKQHQQRLLILLGGVVLIAGVLYGLNGGSKEYRHAMALGDSYFEQRDYGEAEKAYRTAHDLNPGDKQSVESYTVSEELGNIWVAINNGEAGTELHDEIEALLPSISDREVKKAYQEAVESIESSPLYETYKRIDKRYEEEYGSNF